MQMDEVDQKQQEEIEALRSKDKDHDFWIRLLAIGIVGWLMIATTIMMVKLTRWSGDGDPDRCPRCGYRVPQ